MEAFDFEYVSDMVRKKSAIVLEEDKTYLVESRLLPISRREGFNTVSELISKLRSTNIGSLHGKVIEAMTTNETSFFRDLQPFEALRKEIIPDLMAKRSTTRQLRIWCAACSSGQEPYTIAMIIREHFPQLATWDVRILATDLSTQILDKARSGCFNQIEINRGLPAPYVLKYFDRQDMNWKVKSQVQSLIEFRQLNLIELWPTLPEMDIVFIRNVLIYFDVETKKQIFSKIKKLLRHDGYLFLGGAESTINLDESFARTQIDKASVYRLR